MKFDGRNLLGYGNGSKQAREVVERVIAENGGIERLNDDGWGVASEKVIAALRSEKPRDND